MSLSNWLDYFKGILCDNYGKKCQNYHFHVQCELQLIISYFQLSNDFTLPRISNDSLDSYCWSAITFNYSFVANTFFHLNYLIIIFIRGKRSPMSNPTPFTCYTAFGKISNEKNGRYTVCPLYKKLYY